MDFLRKIVIVWQKVNLIQRALLIAVLVAAGLIGWLLVHWARKPEMRVLYHGLAPAEASKITDKIAERKIQYELRDDGTTVCVPQQHVYQLRLDMAKEGLPSGEQAGYKIFDDEKIGVSPFVQNVNLKRALEEELAKSIQMLDGVAYARVHIVDTERRLFASNEEQTSASIVLRLRPGFRVSPANIASITHLVSGSVKGLAAEGVTVVDSQGRLLSGKSDPTLAVGASTVQDYKERVEESLSKKVEELLTAVLGPNRARVQVSAVIDMNSVSTITETYDPTAKVAKTEEETSGSEMKPGAAPAGGGTASAEVTKKDTMIRTEYEVGKTVTQEVVLPGVVKSLTVAAVVDLSVEDPNAAAGTAGQAAAIMEVAEVEQIIRSALGLQQSDSITVVNAKFRQPAEATLTEESSNWPRYMAIAKHSSMGIMAICALIVLRIFSKARKKAASAEGQAPQLGQGPRAAGLLGSGEGPAPEPLAVRRQIAAALRDNPQQVKRLFANWIEQKE